MQVPTSTSPTSRARPSVTHENLQRPEDQEAVAFGWPAVMANLKSLLETGRVMSTAPWMTYEH